MARGGEQIRLLVRCLNSRNLDGEMVVLAWFEVSAIWCLSSLSLEQWTTTDNEIESLLWSGGVHRGLHRGVFMGRGHLVRVCLYTFFFSFFP